MTIAVLLALATVHPVYEPVVPKSETASALIELDRGPERPLEVRVTFPKAGGPHPVIVFSHGMYGSADAVRPMTDFFAQHGYVVLAPTHGDSLKYADRETRRRAFQGSLDNFGSWNERPKEVSLLLDRYAEIEGEVEGLKGKGDLERIGVGGHSFGAWTTQMVAGMELRARQVRTLADPRPKAFLVISPSGLGGGITAESLAAMRGPMMMVSGDKDTGRFQGDPGVHRRQAFEHASPGDKTLVWIEGAHHNFGGINGRVTGGEDEERALFGRTMLGPRNSRHVEIVRTASIAFWDAHLRDHGPAKLWLGSDALEKEGDVKVSRK